MIKTGTIKLLHLYVCKSFVVRFFKGIQIGERKNSTMRINNIQNSNINFTALKMPERKILKKELPSVYLDIETIRPQLKELAKDTKIFVVPHCGDIYVNIGSFNPKDAHAAYPYEHAILSDAEHDKNIKLSLFQIVKNTKELYMNRNK